VKKIFRFNQYKFAPRTRWYDIRFWDPLLGCTIVSTGCINCSSARTVERRDIDDDIVKNGRFNGVIKFNEKAFEEIKCFKPKQQIFACGRSDLFHEEVPEEYIQRIIDCANRRPDCTFLALTKRPHRMGKRVFPKNFWIGISVENQLIADEKLPYFDDVVATKIVSAKPLLGPIDFTKHIHRFDMIALGGEHGTGSRPMHPDWPRQIRDQCIKADKPFSFHNWGLWLPGPGRLTRYVNNDGVFCDESNGAPIHIHEEHEVGTELDGVVWDQYPCAG
jgi:protein gp37